MRQLIAFLVLINAGFAGWAAWIDRPVAPPAAHDIRGLKHLVLGSEVRIPDAGAAPVQASGLPVPRTSSAPAGATAPVAAPAQAQRPR
jgi:hypothetical protein